MKKENSTSNTKKFDLRIIKTKTKIKTALISLLEQKDLQEISFKELAELAKVSRNTLYIHYSSIQNVIEDKINDFVADFNLELSSPKHSYENISMCLCFSCFENVLKKNDNLKFFKELFKIRFVHLLTEKIVETIKNAFIIANPKSSEFPKLIYENYATYLISSCFELYYKYVNGELEITFDELTKNFDLLINETIFSAD